MPKDLQEKNFLNFLIDKLNINFGELGTFNILLFSSKNRKI